MNDSDKDNDDVEGKNNIFKKQSINYGESTMGNRIPYKESITFDQGIYIFFLKFKHDMFSF